jgi:hypothetical protein
MKAEERILVEDNLVVVARTAAVAVKEKHSVYTYQFDTAVLAEGVVQVMVH